MLGSLSGRENGEVGGGVVRCKIKYEGTSLFNSYGVTGLSHRRVGAERDRVHVDGGALRVDCSPLMKDVRKHEVIVRCVG